MSRSTGKRSNRVAADAMLAETIREVADGRFYASGIDATSMADIARAVGVSLRRLRSLYPSKEAIVVAYLDFRHEADVRILERLESALTDARAILHGALDGIISDLVSPGFRGCPFINASAEAGNQFVEVRRRVHEHRDWYAGAIMRLLWDAGHPRPADAADDLMLARDGGMGSIHGGNLVAAVGAMKRVIQRVTDEIPELA